jgi:hypothetical protein
MEKLKKLAQYRNIKQAELEKILSLETRIKVAMGRHAYLPK